MTQIINTPGNDNTGTGMILGIFLVIALAGIAFFFVYPRLNKGGGDINVYNPPAQQTGEITGSVTGGADINIPTPTPSTGQ